MKVLRAFLIQLGIFVLFSSLTIPSFSAEIVLQVNPSKIVAPFSKDMLGVGLVNWDHSWGKPFPGQVPGLAQAYKAAHIHLIRYAGGLWANSVGFDRTPQKNPNTSWTKNGMTYYFNYGTNEIDSLAQLATQAGADVMIQVNISNNDPAMWADMVKYTNKEKNYNFKYWELGNELDSDPDHKISATTYYQRVQQYQTAMLAVDPSIQILAGVPAFPVEQIDGSDPLSGFVTQPSPGGKNLGGISWHWYQTCNTSTLADITRYSWDNTVSTNSWRNAYTRNWAKILPSRIKQSVLPNYPSVKQGVTELNVDACNFNNVYNANHIAAVWFSDVIGRLAYNGINYVTMYTGYGIDGYSILYPDNESGTTKIMARPTYYPLLMYGQYFGDSMIESTSANESQVSIWASKDSADPDTSLQLGFKYLTKLGFRS